MRSLNLLILITLIGQVFSYVALEPRHKTSHPDGGMLMYEESNTRRITQGESEIRGFMFLYREGTTIFDLKEKMGMLLIQHLTDVCERKTVQLSMPVYVIGDKGLLLLSLPVNVAKKIKEKANAILLKQRVKSQDRDAARVSKPCGNLDAFFSGGSAGAKESRWPDTRHRGSYFQKTRWCLCLPAGIPSPRNNSRRRNWFCTDSLEKQCRRKRSGILDMGGPIHDASDHAYANGVLSNNQMGAISEVDSGECERHRGRLGKHKQIIKEKKWLSSGFKYSGKLSDKLFSSRNFLHRGTTTVVRNRYSERSKVINYLFSFPTSLNRQGR